MHDYAGHPFQLQLSRHLARRGDLDVVHLFSEDTVSGKGNTQRLNDDPARLRIAGVRPRAKYVRYSPLGRVRFEASYARELARMITDLGPRVVILCNSPLFVLRGVTRRLEAAGIPWIIWHQDIVSLAVTDELARRSRGASRLIGPSIERVERRAVARASHTVPISPFFLDQYSSWGLSNLAATVIPNWAPLDELGPTPRENAWGKARWPVSDDALRLLYSGTLGRKHNPRLLLDLLDRVQGSGVEASLLVVSEGDGVEDVRAAAAGRHDVTVLPYQPMSMLQDVIGSCDIALGLLEPDASRFSVPSKVLSYLACGRAVCLLAPASNPASATVASAGGASFTPDNAGVSAAAQWCAQLARDRRQLQQLSIRARDYAEQNFAIDRVSDQFAAIISAV